MKKYTISSHWNAEASRLHGKTFESLEEALDALGTNVVDEGWSDEDATGKGCHAIGVYSSKEDLEANAEGEAPHRCLAAIRVINA